MQINPRMLPRKPRAVPRLTTSPTTISGDSSDSSCIVAILEPIETKTTRAATICHDSVLTVGNHSSHFRGISSNPTKMRRKPRRFPRVPRHVPRQRRMYLRFPRWVSRMRRMPRCKLRPLAIFV